MKGTEIADRVATLSPRARGAALMDAALQGLAIPFQLCPVVTKIPGAALTSYVMSDALALGEPGDWFYPNLTAAQASYLARKWQMVIPSAQLVDAAWAQNWQTAPVILPAGPRMASVGYALEATAKRQARHPPPLSPKCEAPTWGQSGKWWVSSPRLWNEKGGQNKAANYGFFTHPTAPAVAPPQPGPRPASTPGVGTLWQTVGLAHSYLNFTDYSQTFRAFYRWAWLVRDGQEPDFADLLTLGLDPKLGKLVSPQPLKMIHPADDRCSQGQGCPKETRSPSMLWG